MMAGPDEEGVYREELAGFGWWFGSRKLDDAWGVGAGACGP